MSKAAMQQALEALEKLMRFESDSWELGSCRVASQAIKALREALAEQPAQQEPVAWARNVTDPQPHCVTDLKYMSVADTDAGVQYTPLYTSPPAQRKPLTDEEISAIGSKIFPSTWNIRHVEFARAIEAKLKEKNNG